MAAALGKQAVRLLPTGTDGQFTAAPEQDQLYYLRQKRSGAIQYPAHVQVLLCSASQELVARSVSADGHYSIVRSTKAKSGVETAAGNQPRDRV
jgi:hypothetical protein